MPRHIESQLQRSCKTWFNYQYRALARLLFSVPNGGRRDPREAAIMRAEGMTAGVADMILLVPRHGYAALCIEFKTDKGRQTEYQRTWQKLVEENGSKYIIVRDFTHFATEINAYLS